MYKKFLVNYHKGLRQKDSPRFFDDGECSIVQDCYLDDVGNIFSRRFVGIVSSYDYAVKTIIPYNSKIYSHLSDGSLSPSGKSGLGSDRLSFVEYNNVLYLGSEKRYDAINSLDDIGNDAPTVDPTPVLEKAVMAASSSFTGSANVTVSKDEHDYKVNPDNDNDIKSDKFEIAAGFATGVVAYSNIGASDVSAFTHIGVWVKCDTSLNAGVLQILLDNTNGCVSPLETIDLPALSINRWTWCVVEIDDPSLLTAVVSVGLNADSDPGVVTVRLDRITAMISGELDGAYYYKYTYVDSNGKESSASDVSDVVNASKELVEVGVTASGVSKVEYINLYRLGGTLTDWYFVTQVADTTQTITDDNPDADLETLFDATDNDGMPTGLTYLAEHYERIIGAKTTTYLNSVLYSKEYEPEYWSLNRQYLVSNKDACTGLLSWGRYIIFCKKDKIFVFEGSDPATWHKRKSDSTYGNLAPWAITFYKVPIFLNYFGLYFFDGNVEKVFSEKVKNFFIDNRGYLAGAISCIFDDKLYLAVNDAVLVYDFILKIFYTYDLTLTDLRYYSGLIYAGNGTNLVRLEKGTNSNSESVNMQIKSKAYPLNDIPNEVGELRNLIVSIDTKSDDVSLNIYIDEVLKQTLILKTASMERLRRGVNPQRGRFVEFEFVYTGTKQIEIQPPLVVNPDAEK